MTNQTEKLNEGKKTKQATTVKILSIVFGLDKE